MLARLKEIKEFRTQATLEREVVIKKHSEIEQKLKERNEFAEKMTEHEEVTHNHAHRIEQANSQAIEDL